MNVYGVRTSQTKVQWSCHDAFLGRSLRAAVSATTAMPATAAREYADVAVKTWCIAWVASVIVGYRGGIGIGFVFDEVATDKRPERPRDLGKKARAARLRPLHCQESALLRLFRHYLRFLLLD